MVNNNFIIFIPNLSRTIYNNIMENKKRIKCEVYSRVVGYMRPVETWNEGKKEEFRDRKEFKNKGI